MARDNEFFQWGLRGDTQLQKVMADLPESFRKRLLRKILQNNGKIVLYEMVDQAPESRGYIASRRRAQGHVPLKSAMAINVSTKARKGGGGTRVRIGAIYPDAAQAHLVDMGTKQRTAKGDRRIKSLGVIGRIRANGLNRGATPATHWVEKSWKNVRERFIASVEDDAVKGILKEGNRLRKKFEAGSA